MRITIACPLEHVEKANQFARCVGLGPEDDKTFGLALWSGPGGTYAVASGVVSDSFPEAAFGTLQEPPWGADLVLADAAQALIMQGVSAAPDRIAAVIGDDVQAALVALGVTLIATPEE